MAGVSRRRGVRTTCAHSSRRAAPDRVERHFQAGAADRIWVADITYVPTWAGFLYLAVVLDVFSRRVVGWSMANHLRTELVLNALNMALARRRPGQVIHHSDQGTQYTSLAFGKRCRETGVIPSTGSVGDCFDNAMAESFFATLECELIDRRSFRTQAEARMAIFEFLEGWYNTRRRHSALGYLSPNDFERAALTPSASPLAGETPPSSSIPRASAAMSKSADSRGRGPHKDILQESSAGQPQAPSEIIHYIPNPESPYLSTESGSSTVKDIAVFCIAFSSACRRPLSMVFAGPHPALRRCIERTRFLGFLAMSYRSMFVSGIPLGGSVCRTAARTSSVQPGTTA